MQILYEDNHLLAVFKPAGVLTQADRPAGPSLLADVRHDLKVRFAKPGQVFVGLVHRLDRPVAGVVVFARTSKAAARLAAQFRAGTVQKEYWAWVAGRAPLATATLHHELLRDEAHGLTRALASPVPGSRHAVLTYRALGETPAGSLLTVHPATGRKHQIRCQLAAVGLPILGDVRYGGPAGPAPDVIGLFARAIVFDHPVRHHPVTISATLPADWAWPLPPGVQRA